jgi:predicted P-loop ATPase
MDGDYDNINIVQLLEAMKKRGKKPKAPPREKPNDWRMLLAESSEGYLGDERNILIAMRNAPELKDLVRYNAMALDVELTRSPPWRKLEEGPKWTETDDTHCIAWLQSRELKARNRGAVADCVAVVAQEASYHPVRDYLKALKWDGEPRLKIWLAEYLNALGDPPYQEAIGKRYLVSGVARILQPGCQADHVLVLEGPQGSGKTTAARTLAVNPQWFAGELPDIGSKDAMLQLLGRWIIEIAELKAVKTSEIERTKSYITQTHDTFRPPYGRRTAQFPRQCVFIGTTNEA